MTSLQSHQADGSLSLARFIGAFRCYSLVLGRLSLCNGSQSRTSISAEVVNGKQTQCGHPATSEFVPNQTSAIGRRWAQYVGLRQDRREQGR